VKSDHHAYIALTRWLPIVTGLLMICLFFILRALNLNYILKFHFLNILIIVPAVWLTCRAGYKRNGENFRYLKGLASGVKTIIIASVIVNFFIVIYLSFINPVMMFNIRHYMQLGEYMNPLIIGMVLFTEQICASLIVSLIVMQLYKAS